MKSRDPDDFPSAPGTIRFDHAACCALWMAWQENERADIMLIQAIGEDEITTYVEVLPGTHSELKFIPTDDMKLFYNQLARVELKRLAAHPQKFSCHQHTINEHKIALNKVIAVTHKAEN